MKGPSGNGSASEAAEGKVKITSRPTGGFRGPGRRSAVFYNPAMVRNRDLSLVIVQSLIDNGRMPGTGDLDFLDGLTGSGIRAVRFRKELSSDERRLRIFGVDLNETSIENARDLASANGTDVEFHQGDLNLFLGNMRYHYIDVDPYGTPVPFLQKALLSVRKKGYLAVTATDTAALTGSVPRVALRRYGIVSGRTHFMQEMGARSLMGYLARQAASFEISVEPVFFYSKDHFVRGYVKTDRGAKKADRTLSEVGWLQYSKPMPPSIIDAGEPGEGMEKSRVLGPVWTGPLSDPGIARECIETMERRQMGYLDTYKEISGGLALSLEEDLLPPGGFDLNETASFLGTSPPSIEKLSQELLDAGGRWSRSRFSPTILKTDLPWKDILEAFKRAGGER